MNGDVFTLLANDESQSILDAAHTTDLKGLEATFIALVQQMIDAGLTVPKGQELVMSAFAVSTRGGSGKGAWRVGEVINGRTIVGIRKRNSGPLPVWRCAKGHEAVGSRSNIANTSCAKCTAASRSAQHLGRVINGRRVIAINPGANPDWRCVNCGSLTRNRSLADISVRRCKCTRVRRYPVGTQLNGRTIIAAAVGRKSPLWRCDICGSQATVSVAHVKNAKCQCVGAIGPGTVVNGRIAVSAYRAPNGRPGWVWRCPECGTETRGCPAKIKRRKCSTCSRRSAAPSAALP